MRIVFWNVRGCNKSFKQKVIKIFFQTNKVDVAVLLEIRGKQEKSQKILSKMCRGWNTINNYGIAMNVKVWINWNPRNVQIQLLAEHEHALLCEITDIHTGKHQHLLAVYALNTIEQRKLLWDFLGRNIPQCQGHVLIGEDFNVVLSTDDRFQGNPVSAMDIEDFQKCILENELQEVRAEGPQFTWTNNQEWDNKICSNIDRCFANTTWFTEYSTIVVERLEKGVSDHCPQLLRFEPTIVRKRLFKLYNVVADHEQFIQIVRDHWGQDRNSNKLRNIWLNCLRLKSPLKKIKYSVVLEK